MEIALVAHLTGDATLAALIGDRVEPSPLSEFSDLPAITWIDIGIAPTQHRSSRKAKHGRTRVQFDLWAGDPLTLLNVRTAFVDAMATFNQTSGPRVDGATLQQQRDAYEAEPTRWRQIIEYYIWHEET